MIALCVIGCTPSQLFCVSLYSALHCTALHDCSNVRVLRKIIHKDTCHLLHIEFSHQNNYATKCTSKWDTTQLWTGVTNNIQRHYTNDDFMTSICNCSVHYYHRYCQLILPLNLEKVSDRSMPMEALAIIYCLETISSLCHSTLYALVVVVDYGSFITNKAVLFNRVSFMEIGLSIHFFLYTSVINICKFLMWKWNWIISDKGCAKI